MAQGTKRRTADPGLAPRKAPKSVEHETRFKLRYDDDEPRTDEEEDDVGRKESE